MAELNLRNGWEIPSIVLCGMWLIIHHLTSTTKPSFKLWHGQWFYLDKITYICINLNSWCRIYASVNWASIGWISGLSLDRRQAIIWTNAGILLIRPLGTNFSESRFKYKSFHSWKCIWKLRLRNGGHFFQGGWGWGWSWWWWELINVGLPNHH